ncbi:MAG TPA: recombinase family protein [Allosphingosinicella sp.]|nr:recombinase family protein [Allosphingosinicella sp.]
MAVYGYSRVSTDRQADDGESLSVQERQIAGWCMMHDHDLTDMFVDSGVSGSVPVGLRPAGGELMKRLKPGDIIVAPKLDRLFRSALDALQTVEAMRAKRVSIWLLDHLGEITGNGMAKAFLTIAAAFAELERDQIRERIVGVKRDQKARGRYLGGRVPFGYDVLEANDDGRIVMVLEPVEAEQKIIAEIKALRGTKGPPFKSMRYIQDMIEQRHGRRLALATIHRVLNDGKDILGGTIPKVYGD